MADYEKYLGTSTGPELDQVGPALTKIDTLETRLDNAIAASLPSGSEIEDIRLAYNGEQYTTAGQAVRAQAGAAYELSYDLARQTAPDLVVDWIIGRGISPDYAEGGNNYGGLAKFPAEPGLTLWYTGGNTEEAPMNIRAYWFNSDGAAGFIRRDDMLGGKCVAPEGTTLCKITMSRTSSTGRVFTAEDAAFFRASATKQAASAANMETLSVKTQTIDVRLSEAESKLNTAVTNNGVLPSGADLNEYNQAGVWFALTTTARTLVNAPTGLDRDCTLVVLRGSSTQSRGWVQLLYTTTGTTAADVCTAYTRQIHASGVWGKWSQVNKADQYPAKGLACRCIGDSITRGLYETGSVGWVGRIGAICGFASVAKDGVGGAHMAVWEGRSDSVYERVMAYTEAESADVFIVCGGVNDLIFGGQLGGINSTDETTVCGALNGVIGKLRTLYPSAKIVLCSPTKFYIPGLYSTAKTDSSYCPNNRGYDGSVISAMYSAIAVKWGVAYLDLFGLGPTPFDPESRALYFSDGLHYTADGYELLAKIIGGFINSGGLDVAAAADIGVAGGVYQRLTERVDVISPADLLSYCKEV